MINLIMNEILNKFLLAGDKFMPEMHLKHSREHLEINAFGDKAFKDVLIGLMYHFVKTKKEYKNLKK